MDSLVKPITKLRYYQEAICGASLPASRQIALLVSLMGNDAEDIYENFTFGEKVRTLEVAWNKFDAYFLPRRNLTYERQVFFTCSQREGQTFDTYGGITEDV
ncbi:hypothetical protein PR048_017028 [Dryococelus australis]|uniref:Uncharacterized protein n=1 Tax=Dryococelus australis TaxID=614101 RepID=A0ABQ9H8E0_9NEOP|nr:hypothetical protein PR048_017028 [Dryococelus australis]